jgi:hypothetical protein
MRSRSSVHVAGTQITIIHDASISDVVAHAIDPGLSSIVRSASARRSVLRRLAASPEARLTLAVHNGTIIGHTAAGPSFGRWLNLPHVREVAFEVARAWRRTGVATLLTETALADPAVEDEILLGFLWPSAWDTEYVGLPRTAYREMIATFCGRYGFRMVETDEPEITSQFGGALIARIGAGVPEAAVQAFDDARFERRVERRVAA